MRLTMEDVNERTLLKPGPSIQTEQKIYNGSETKTTAKDSACDYIDNVLSEIGFGTFQVLAFFMVGVSYMGFISQTLTFSFSSIDLTDLWKLNGVQYSLVSVTTCGTNLIGEAVGGYIADRYGRFWPYVISLLILTVFIAASAFSRTFYTFLIFRSLAAVGTGGLMVLMNPTLIEFLPIKNRGSSTILTGIIQAFGSCIAGGFAWWLIPGYDKHHGWRYYILFTAGVTCLAFLFRIVFYFESPRYLISKGKADAAWKLLKIIGRLNRRRIEEITSQEEFIKNVTSTQTLACSKSKHTSSTLGFISSMKTFLIIFKRPYLRRTLLLLIIYNTQDIAYYGSTLFLPYSLQILGADPYFIAFVGFVAQIPGIALMAIIVEWPLIGRLNALRFFSLLSAISFFLFGFIQNQIATPVLTVVVYFSIIPNQPLVMTYISESFPTEVRVKAIALMTVVSAMNGFWTPFVSGYMADMMKIYSWLSSVVWGSVFLFQFLVSLLLKHETRGRSLQDNFTFY